MASEGVQQIKQILDKLGLSSEYEKLANDGYETVEDVRAMLEADLVDCGLKKVLQCVSPSVRTCMHARISHYDSNFMLRLWAYRVMQSE